MMVMSIAGRVVIMMGEMVGISRVGSVVLGV